MNYTFRSINLSFILTIILSIFLCSITFGQSPVITEMTRFTMCRIDKTNGSEFDCQEKVGILVYSKIKVIPNISITAYLKGDTSENKAITVRWDFSKLKMNTDKDLFIYEFGKSDITKTGGGTVSIVMRLNYSVQQIVDFFNYEGEYNKFTMY